MNKLDPSIVITHMLNIIQALVVSMEKEGVACWFGTKHFYFS